MKTPDEIRLETRRAWHRPLLAAGAIVGAMAGINALIAWRTPPPSLLLGGTFGRYPFRNGDIAYTVKGEGPPMLLLHDLRPGADMSEWRGIFESLSRSHTVYALDFPGWGLSPARQSQPSELGELIRFFAQDMIEARCALVASNAASYAVLSATHHAPELFSSVSLICPPSLESEESSLDALLSHDAAWTTEQNFKRVWRETKWQIFRIPIFNTTLRNALTSRHRLEKLARRDLFFDPSRADEPTLRRLHAGAHRKGTHHTTAAYFSGLLRGSWRAAWAESEMPCLLLWGRNARASAAGDGLESAPEWLALQPRARLEVVDEAMLLPHLEHPQRVAELLRAFVDGVENAAVATSE